MFTKANGVLILGFQYRVVLVFVLVSVKLRLWSETFNLNFKNIKL